MCQYLPEGSFSEHHHHQYAPKASNVMLAQGFYNYSNIFYSCRAEKTLNKQLEEKVHTTEEELEETKAKMAEMEEELKQARASMAEHQNKTSRSSKNARSSGGTKRSSILRTSAGSRK